MSNDKSAALTGVSFVQECMAFFSMPGSSVLGKAVDNALEKRRQKAIEILIEMIGAGKAEDIIFGESDADELVQMLMRFWRASEIGSAKQNLKLLSNVIIGLKRNRSFAFDRFQVYANILETMTRDEILLVGKVYDLTKNNRNMESKSIKDALAVTFEHSAMGGIFAALTRTGLFMPISAYGGLNYKPSPSLYELCELAQIQVD